MSTRKPPSTRSSEHRALQPSPPRRRLYARRRSRAHSGARSHRSASARRLFGPPVATDWRPSGRTRGKRALARQHRTTRCATLRDRDARAPAGRDCAPHPPARRRLCRRSARDRSRRHRHRSGRGLHRAHRYARRVRRRPRRVPGCSPVHARPVLRGLGAFASATGASQRILRRRPGPGERLRGRAPSHRRSAAGRARRARRDRRELRERRPSSRVRFLPASTFPRACDIDHRPPTRFTRSARRCVTSAPSPRRARVR